VTHRQTRDDGYYPRIASAARVKYDCAKLKNESRDSHVILTTPLIGVVCHRRLQFDTVHLHAQFDGSSFSRSRDMVGDHPPKFKWFP